MKNVKILQIVFWVFGFAVFLDFFMFPEIALHAFWNVLIPVAPALFVVAPGLWRNVCPLGSTVLLSHKFKFSLGLKITQRTQDRLSFIGLALLFLLVPFRHVIMNTSGIATALTILAMTLIGFILTVFFTNKSVWCSGMCPVHHVEKFYGLKPVYELPNAHCDKCSRCVKVCPDSVPSKMSYNPHLGSRLQRFNTSVMIGAFPGFIWGWFHIPDFHGIAGFDNLFFIYIVPLLFGISSYAAYVFIKTFVPFDKHQHLVAFYAFLAVSCYYWYRIPSLIGFGNELFLEDGRLVDLSMILPEWFPILTRILVIVVFAWLLLFRNRGEKAWSTRPQYAVES